MSTEYFKAITPLISLNYYCSLGL